MTNGILLELQRPSPTAVEASYRVAGRLVRCRPPLAELAPFLESLSKPPATAFEGATGHPPVGEPGAEPGSEPGRKVFSGRGWVGGRLLQVECWSGERGSWLDIAGAGSLWVSPLGDRVVALAPAHFPGLGLVQAALGPALSLALALNGVYCLHASAVAIGGAAVIFLGESGAGKSTLASRLAVSRPGAWWRAADDILPVSMVAPHARAHPNFPQLKLGPSEQWPASAPESLRVAAIYRLRLTDRSSLRATGGGVPFEARDLSRRDATLAVVRHTVAGLLFGEGLKARHLEFAAGLASSVGVRELQIPRGDSLPSGLAERVAKDAGVL